MALEPIGDSFNVAKLKARLQKRYPNYNFDVPAPPDTTCKAPALCANNTIYYTDMEGNKYCGLSFVQVADEGFGKASRKTCHAMIQKVDLQDLAKDKQEEIF